MGSAACIYIFIYTRTHATIIIKEKEGTGREEARQTEGVEMEGNYRRGAEYDSRDRR